MQRLQAFGVEEHVPFDERDVAAHLAVDRGDVVGDGLLGSGWRLSDPSDLVDLPKIVDLAVQDRDLLAYSPNRTIRSGLG